jgi:hypothetical protein
LNAGSRRQFDLTGCGGWMLMISCTLRERLEHGVSLLTLIDRRRAETGLRYLGANIEGLIVERELRELEAATISDEPGTGSLPMLRIIR